MKLLQLIKKLYYVRLGVAGFWISLILFGLLITSINSIIDIKEAQLDILFFIIIIFFVSSLYVRRLHDLNYSAYWIFFIFFAPIVGQIMALVISLSPSKNSPNRFGERPKKIIDQILVNAK